MYILVTILSFFVIKIISIHVLFKFVFGILS